MLYLEYAKLRLKVQKLEDELDKALDERQDIFERTQPKSVDYKKERVNSQSTVNTNDSYLIALERRRIDERVKEYKSTLNDRKTLLGAKESELRVSNNRYDRVYCKIYLDCCKIGAISKELNYSRSQVWRMLKEIKANIGRLIV
jgi:hypothetical protein